MRRCSKFAEFMWGYSVELARKREGTSKSIVHDKRLTFLVIKIISAHYSTGSDKAERAAVHQRRVNVN